MKKLKIKKWILYFLMVVIILSLLLTYMFTSKKIDYNTYFENISESRINHYFGSGSNFEITFSSGYRESDYKLNGIHTKNVEFGVLTVKLPKELNNVENGTFKINYGNKVINGELQKNPFDSTLMADIGFIIKDYDSIKVTIILFDRIKIFDLYDVSKDFKFNYLDALKIFIDNNYKELKPFFIDGKFNAEIYVKIMHDNKIDSKYYYLIRIINKSGNMISGIINPISGEILAVNNDKF